MPSVIQYIFPATQIQKRISSVARHWLVKGVNFVFAIAALLICIFILVANGGRGKDSRLLVIFTHAVCIAYINVARLFGVPFIGNPSILRVIVVDDSMYYRMANGVSAFLFSWILLYIMMHFNLRMSGPDRHANSNFLLFVVTVFPIYLEAVILTMILITVFAASISSPERTFEELKSADGNVSADSECSICKDEFVDSDLVKRLNCTHFFHSSCIDEWLTINKSCPLCKQSLYQGNSIRDIIKR